jgi:hypothetical protein
MWAPAGSASFPPGGAFIDSTSKGVRPAISEQQVHDPTGGTGS